MRNVFDKRIFKNKENKSKLINLIIYEKNLKLFNINSLFGKIYPSLLSKCISFKNGNYWEERFSIFSISNFIINPLKIIRLLFSYFKILLIYIFGLIKRKKIICLLTRTQGIRQKTSIEDYRFKGLEERLKKEFYIVYFFHGKNKSKSATNFPVIYSSDIYNFSKVIFLLIYPFLKVYFTLKKKPFLFWHFELAINLFSTLILSFYSRFINISFFWDFNYYHYPLFLASHLTKTKLIGSMHNFNYYYQLPWISDATVRHLKIKYKFNDYKSIFNFLKNNYAEKNKKSLNLMIKNSNLNIVIIQENQTNQESLIKFIFSIKNKINKIYIKIRPDKDKSDLLINLLKFYNLKFDYINDIFAKNTKNFIFFGTSSSLLLDLAATNRIAISFSTNKKKVFNFPSRNFIQLFNTEDIHNLNDQKIIENPIYISNKSQFTELINHRKLIVQANSTRNHHMFNKHKIDSIMNLVLS